MGNLYLIRHGQASFGASDYDVLSPIGQRQARLLGKFLAATGLRPHHCFAGSLRRQQDTARHTLAELPDSPAVEIMDGFNEFDAQGIIKSLLPGLLPSEPQALNILRNAAEHPAAFQRLFEQIMALWLEGAAGTEHTESWAGFLARTAAALEAAIERAGAGENIAVFTSGGVITALLHRYTGLAASEAFRLNWQIYNSSISHLRFHGTDITLASFNGHAHLQLANSPELITWR